MKDPAGHFAGCQRHNLSDDSMANMRASIIYLVPERQGRFDSVHMAGGLLT